MLPLTVADGPSFGVGRLYRLTVSGVTAIVVQNSKEQTRYNLKMKRTILLLLIVLSTGLQPKQSFMASAPFTSDDFSRDKAKKKISSFPIFLSKKFGKFSIF